MNRNQSVKNSKFFRRGNNSSSSNNNSSNNSSNSLNRLEFLSANGYINNGSRTIKFKNTRRVRNIEKKGRSIPASVFRQTMKTRTRKHIGSINSHPIPVTNRFISKTASQLLANAHAASNTYQQMSSYINKSNMTKYYPKGFPKQLMNKQIPLIKEIAFYKLNRSYSNLVEEPVGAVAPKLPNGNNWTEL